MGSYSSHLLLEDVPEDFGVEVAVRRMPANPNIWSEGSLVLTRYLGLHRRVRMFMCLALLGVVVSGGTLTSCPMDLVWNLVGACAQFLVLCRLFKGLKCEVLFWHVRRWMLFMWRWTILMSSGMLGVLWMALSLLVLLS